MLPSCGWSQLSLVVGTGPMFRRSMWTASSSRAWNASLVGERRAHERRADRVDHLRLGTLDDGHEREHELLLRDRGVRTVGVHDRRQQVVGASVFRDARRVAVLRGDVGDARRREVRIDRRRDRVGHTRHGERRERRVGVVGRQRPNAGEPSRQSVGDLARVPARPDAGSS